MDSGSTDGMTHYMSLGFNFICGCSTHCISEKLCFFVKDIDELFEYWFYITNSVTMGNVPMVVTKGHKKSGEKKQWKEHEKTNWTGLKWSSVDSTMVKSEMWTEKMIVISTKKWENEERVCQIGTKKCYGLAK
jgi:hypothetical protein